MCWTPTAGRCSGAVLDIQGGIPHSIPPCLKELQVWGRRHTGNIILTLCGSWYCQSIFRRPDKTWKHTVPLPNTSFSTSSPKQLLLSVSFQTGLRLVTEGTLTHCESTACFHHPDTHQYLMACSSPSTYLSPLAFQGCVNLFTWKAQYKSFIQEDLPCPAKPLMGNRTDCEVIQNSRHPRGLHV